MIVTTTSKKVRFGLSYNGEGLRNLGKDGPWTLRIRLLLRDNLDPETGEPRPGSEAVELEPSAGTKPWTRDQFGRLAAYGRAVGHRAR